MRVGTFEQILVDRLVESGVSFSAPFAQELVHRVARHEAGHAVAYTVLTSAHGVELATIDCPPLGNVRGLVRVNWNPARNPQDLDGLETGAYAGAAAEYPEAELRVMPPPNPLTWQDDPSCVDIWESSTHDRATLEVEASLFGHRHNGEQWDMAAWRRAQRFVIDHEVAIDAVRDELLEAGTVSGGRIYQILVHGRE